MPERAYSEQPPSRERGASSAPPSAAVLDVDAGGERVRVRVFTGLSGDGRQLPAIVRRALEAAAGGVDLDLSAVTSCDTAGLCLLLDLRRRALDEGKTVTICAGSPAVDRHLELTGTRSLFTPSNGRGKPQSAGQGPGLAYSTDQDPHAVIAQLQRAIRTRPTIDLARGILMASFGLSPDRAWDVLVTASQNANTKLHRLAGEVVNAAQGVALPPAVREQLATAVVKANAEPAPPPDEPVQG
ncbi:ANTAR domain-containing protein [Streptomyces sp. NPDC059785]|uniref:ANTAR domain-containing protein n=1 Tax=unclassified Streptomyces TaxID=2593676 RepID=UPI0036571C53